MFDFLYTAEFVLVFGALFLILLEIFLPIRGVVKGRIAQLISLLSVLVCGAFLIAELGVGLEDLFTYDNMGMFYKFFILISTFLLVLFSIDYSEELEHFVLGKGMRDLEWKKLDVSQSENPYNEYLGIILIVSAGMMWLASANDFLVIFLSLEMVSIGLFVLVGYFRYDIFSLEASIKYLVLGALSACFLVFGFSWIFGIFGESNLFLISEKINNGFINDSNREIILVGILFILVSILFKVGAFPFHTWVSDVYYGAPMPITAFLSIASKATGFVVLSRLLGSFVNDEWLGGLIINFLLIVGSITIIVGNFGALYHKNLKRIMGYSSIAHSGFILLAVASFRSELGINTAKAIAFYLFTYLLGTYIVMYGIGIVRKNRGRDFLDDIAGLSKENIWLTILITVGILSLAGVPLTAGFFAKFFIISLTIEQGFYVPTLVALLGAIVSFIYYFRIIATMFTSSVDGKSKKFVYSKISFFFFLLLMIFVIILGFYPKVVFYLFMS